MRFRLLIEAKADEDKLRQRINNDELVNQFLELKRKNIIKGADGDLYKYNNADQLEAVIKSAITAYENRQSARGKDVLSSNVKNNTNYIYEDDKVQIIQPLTFESSYYYGKATTWCICGRYDGNCSPNSVHWDNYTDQGCSFIFIIDKTRKKEHVVYDNANGKEEIDYHKYCLVIADNQIVDIVDSITDDSICNCEVIKVNNNYNFQFLCKCLSKNAIDKLQNICSLGSFLSELLVSDYIIDGTISYIETYDDPSDYNNYDDDNYLVEVEISNFFDSWYVQFKDYILEYLQSKGFTINNEYAVDAYSDIEADGVDLKLSVIVPVEDIDNFSQLLGQQVQW